MNRLCTNLTQTIEYNSGTMWKYSSVSAHDGIILILKQALFINKICKLNRKFFFPHILLQIF